MAKSFKRIIYLNLYTIFFTFIFLIVFALSIILLIPTYFLRLFVTLARKLFRPDLGKLVTTRSAVIAGTDDPNKDPKWNLCVWLILEGKLDLEQAKINFYNKIILKKLPNGQLHSPEYQQYLHRWLGYMFWKWEKDFQVNDHIRYLFPPNSDKVLDEDGFRQIIKDLTYEPFQEGKSPWQILYVPNYRDDESPGGGKSALIIHVHHGICDGYSILHLLMKEANNIDLTGIAVADKFKVQPSRINKLIQGLLFCFTSPYLFVKMLVRTVDTNEWHLPSHKLSRPYNAGFTEKIPISFIKEIKNIHQVSFSAVIYACITAAIRRGMLENGKKVPEYMSTAVAVPMPGHPLKLRNHFIFSFLQLPTGIEDPLTRLQKVERNIRRLKQSPVPLFSFGLIPIVGGSLTPAMKLFSKNPYSTVLTSNFPGPPVTSYFIADGGHTRVTDMNFTAGLGEGDVGIGFCILSYDGHLRVITSFAREILETDAMVDIFNRKIIEELEILRGGSNYV